MYIGYMGDIVFFSSDSYLLTPAKFKRSGSARWAEHDVVLNKPVSQFVGQNLETVSFKLHLIKYHGVDPDEQLRKLREMRDTGKVFPLIIGGKPVTQNYWRIESLSEDETYYDAYGKLIQCTADISLKEYDDSNYIEENAQIDKYGRDYNTAATLLGGL